MVAIEEQISALSDAELETFASGITCLDHSGNIRFMNAAEAGFTNRKPQDVIGLNFFRDVAPCAAVRNFQGRFDRFVATPDVRSSTFGFIYPVWLGHKQVKITMVRRAGDDEHVILVTEFLGTPNADGTE